MRLKNLEEGSFWGRDDLVKRMKDEEKASGMKKFVKVDDDGNHRGVTTSDKEKWEELKAQGYKEDENYFNETNVNEDETDNEKKSAIYNLRMSLQSLKDEVNELADLDNTPNASGRGDLHDQLATMDKLTSSFEAVLGRAYDIVPGDDVIEGKYKNDAQRKAVHASKAEKLKEFGPDERYMKIGNNTMIANKKTGSVSSTLSLGGDKTATVNNHLNKDGSAGKVRVSGTVGGVKFKASNNINGNEPKASASMRGVTINASKKPKMKEDNMNNRETDPREFVLNAVEVAKDIQKNNYYFSDSTYYEFTDGFDTDDDDFLEHDLVQQVMRALPHVDMDKAEIKQAVDALANMRMEEAVTEASYQYDMTDKGDMVDALGDVHDSMNDAVKNIQKAAGLTSKIYHAIEDTLYTDESVESKKLKVREAGSPWTTTGKHPEKMTPDELWTEIAVFDELQDRGETLSPKDMMRLDSLFAYMDTAEMNEAIKRKADLMIESAVWKAKKQ